MTTSTLPRNPLDQKLLQVVAPLDAEVRRSILSSVWNLKLSKEDYNLKPKYWGAYFRHYEEQCEQLSPCGISALTHRQILDIIKVLKHKARVACSQELLGNLPQSLHILVEDAVNFAANALLLLNISRWNGDQLLKDFVRSRFAGPSVASEKLKLKKSFSAQTLDGVAGIKVHWTADITQHLSMRHDDTELAMFHHVAVLELYKSSKIDIIPEEVLEETRKTLSLLLPHTTKAWFKKQQERLQKKKWYKHDERLHLDPRAGSGEHLRADERSLDSFGATIATVYNGGRSG